MKNKIVNLLVILIISFSYHSVNAETPLTPDSPEKIKMALVRKANSYDGLFAELVYTEAFKRVGKELIIGFYSPSRANVLIKSGKVDGDLARMPDFNKFYPNMLKVEEPTIIIHFSAFTTDSKIKVKGWESLINTDYRIECMRGQKICDDYRHKVVDKQKITQVTHWSQGLNKLILRRTDIFIGVERTVLHALKSDEFKKKGIQISGIMEEVPIHAFLHVKHKELTVKLSRVLIEMKQEGLIEHYDKIARNLTYLYLNKKINRPYTPPINIQE